MQAAEGTAAKRPEAAAASGRTLLNLHARDAEGGLLGRTLLTLVSNKARRLRHGIFGAHAAHAGHNKQVDAAHSYPCLIEAITFAKRRCCMPPH